MEQLALSMLAVFIGIVLIPPLAHRVRIPIIVAEIIFGIAIGVSFLDIVPESQTVDFFSSFGLAYLMFLAGMDLDLRVVRRHVFKATTIAAVSVGAPLLSGVLLASYVGVHPMLLGTILSTTSLGLVLPLLKDLRARGDFANLMLGTVVIVDIVSIFLLAFSLSVIQGPLQVEFFYSLAAILILFVIPMLLSRSALTRRFASLLSRQRYFDLEVRLAFALIFLLAAISGQLGFHSIMGAFIAGLIFSEIMPRATRIEEKLESFGYGFFIPLFFIFTGARVDLPSLFSDVQNLGVLAVILAVGLLSKMISVSVVTRLLGMKPRESAAFGLFHAARLSLIIAAADIVVRLGLIDRNLFSTLVLLAISSALIAPALGRYVLGRSLHQEPEPPAHESVAAGTPSDS